MAAPIRSRRVRGGRGFYQRALLDACRRPCHTVLELGSGGGNNASYLKSRFSMVLVDPSLGMLEVSRSFSEGGFDPKVVPINLSDLEPGQYEIFVCGRPE